MIIAVIGLGILCACLVVAMVIIMRKSQPADNQSALLLKQDITTLNESVIKLKDGLQTQISERLDRNNQMMMGSIQKQFKDSSKIVTDVTARLTKLDETNKRVVSVADELKVLQNVLQNPKQRGVLGEFYLEQILQNMLPPGSYVLQHKISEGLVVDAAIKIDGNYLPIDSKFSLENYNRLVEAKGDQRKALEKQFKEDLKKRIDETAKYIQPRKGMMEQALMFIPSEAIYYDLLANKVGVGGVNGRDLMQYAAVDKHVSIVGPSTLAAVLQIITQQLRSLQIQGDTEVIRKNVEQLTKHLINYDGYFKKIGVSLGATVGHYNNASKELTRVDKDIVKIADKGADIEPLMLDKPSQVDSD